MQPTAASVPSQRLASIDAYRGLVMFLMMAEVLRLCEVADRIPASGFWEFLCLHQSHAAWVGCSLHDMIQPSFSFLVGVALPFSLASRTARGQSIFRMSVHALWRAILLVVLGIFLRSLGHPSTYFTFEDTLSQIGLGYGVLFLIGLRPTRDAWIALGLILVGYWAAFALYPLPGPAFDWSKTGVTPDWEYNLTGFAAHWSNNTNLAWAFDTWFLNRFPREHAFTHNDGGYSTLSFIPTLGTMILGLVAGRVLQSGRKPWGKAGLLVTAGAAALAAGFFLGELGICPVVKRIWTPSWTLYSGGWCFLILAVSYVIIDMAAFRRWTFPFIVIGMNSIAAYCMDWLFIGFIRKSLATHLGADSFKLFGEAYATLVQGVLILLVLWLILFWMYRRKLFLKI